MVQISTPTQHTNTAHPTAHPDTAYREKSRNGSGKNNVDVATRPEQYVAQSQNSTAQASHSVAQHSTAQASHSVAQHSTAQHSAAQRGQINVEMLK